MASLNLDDWLGWNASSFMPSDPAASYFPPDVGDPTPAPSSIVADRLARKGLSAPSPKSAALNDGVDDWIVPPAQSMATAGRAGTSASQTEDRFARHADSGLDDWIHPPAQTATGAGPAATSGASAFNRVFPNDGGPDDWIYPQPPTSDSTSGAVAGKLLTGPFTRLHAFSDQPIRTLRPTRP